MSVRLISVEIEGFRGFARAQSLPLDADVVLVSGSNGTGKTSLTDAIVWCLTGALPALAARLEGERKEGDYVTSEYASGPARVALRLRAGDRILTFERRGDATGSDLTLTQPHSTENAETTLASIFGFQSSETLGSAIQAWGVLRQDSLRATLEEGSAALHGKLRDILGLGMLAEFEAATATRAKELKSEAEAARLALDKLEQQIRETDSALVMAHERKRRRDERAGQRTELLDGLVRGIRGVHVTLPTNPSPTDVTTAGRQVAALRDVAADLLTRVAGSDAATDVSEESARVATQRLADLEALLTRAEAQSDARRRLEEAAITLLTDHCPVCAQTVDEATLRAKLSASLAADPSESDLAGVRNEVFEARSHLHQIENQRRDAAQRQHTREQAQIRWRAALQAAPDVAVPDKWQDLASADEAAEVLTVIRGNLQALYRDAVASQQDPLIAQLTSGQRDLASAVGEAKAFAEAIAQRAKQADHLRKAATVAAVEITEQSLSAMEPAFAEVYNRLAPHPSFTRLRMVHETYYGKGRSSPRILDPIRNVEANPALVFSEGQLNIVALSYFLALNLETDRGGLPFAILDDPLQAMDVVNVLGFSDVVRALRDRRQIILTTHDRRFASLLERKLTPRRGAHSTLRLEFDSWDVAGPEVAAHRSELETVPSLLGAA